jgi:hypothetical protein
VTEAEWSACNVPLFMLRHLTNELASERRGYAVERLLCTTDRKLRLFACACCRAIWHLLPDEHSRAAVQVAERFADGHATIDELAEASEGATATPWLAARAAARYAGWKSAVDAGRGAADCAHRATARAATRGQQADLLRHIVGNPFRPYSVPASWPTLIVDLAQQLYDGADVRLILNDALLDAGHADLAEHFRQEVGHPKGCWALDVVLGKR